MTVYYLETSALLKRYRWEPGSESLGVLPRYPLRAADALHFATALRVSRAVGSHDFCLVSGDKELGEACAGYRLRLLDPEAPSALVQLRGLK